MHLSDKDYRALSELRDSLEKNHASKRQPLSEKAKRKVNRLKERSKQRLSDTQLGEKKLEEHLTIEELKEMKRHATES